MAVSLDQLFKYWNPSSHPPSCLTHQAIPLFALPIKPSPFSYPSSHPPSLTHQAIPLLLLPIKLSPSLTHQAIPLLLLPIKPSPFFSYPSSHPPSSLTHQAIPFSYPSSHPPSSFTHQAIPFFLPIKPPLSLTHQTIPPLLYPSRSTPSSLPHPGLGDTLWSHHACPHIRSTLSPAVEDFSAL